MKKQTTVYKKNKLIPVSSDALRRACSIAGSRAKLSVLLQVSDGLLGVYIHQGRIRPELLLHIERTTGVTVQELLLPAVVQQPTTDKHRHGAPVL